MLFGWSSISIASLISRSMYRDWVDRILVFCSWMRCPRLMLCSAAADLSGWARRMCRWCSLILVSIERPVCPMWNLTYLCFVSGHRITEELYSWIYWKLSQNGGTVLYFGGVNGTWRSYASVQPVSFYAESHRRFSSAGQLTWKTGKVGTELQLLS
jgi:hypothetical protein